MIRKTWSHLSSYFLTKSTFSKRIFILCYLISCNQIKSIHIIFCNWILNIYRIAKLRLTQSLWIRTYKFYYFDSFLVHLLKVYHKHRQRITAYNSEITSKGIGIKLLSLNLYILVGILILILWMCWALETMCLSC